MNTRFFFVLIFYKTIFLFIISGFTINLSNDFVSKCLISEESQRSPEMINKGMINKGENDKQMKWQAKIKMIITGMIEISMINKEMIDR